MKRYFLMIVMAALLPLCSLAQSSMTDEQVLQFVVDENASGTSQAQIVTKLMQRGVDISQIRRVRQKYERLAKNQGLGAVSGTGTSSDSRLRTNNGKSKKSSTRRQGDDYGYDENSDEMTPTYRLKDTRYDDLPKSTSYDETNEDWLMMQDELNGFLPDTAAIVDMYMNREKKKKIKVFGRDIFNNKELTFEPDMNIATPQSYRLGPGDAVFIDIYGASQKTIESTISPDGSVTIEGFGPVQIGGLTVEQANSKLRSTLGARYSSSKIKLTVGQTRTIMVNVMGEVENPGTYTLPAFATVFHALYMAGGTNDLGTLRNIKVYRAFECLRFEVYFPVFVGCEPQVHAFVYGKSCYQTMLMVNMCSDRADPVGCEDMILVFHGLFLLNKSFTPVFPVFPVLGFENYARLEYLDGMPCSGWNLAAILSVGRGEVDALCLIAVVVIEDFIKPATEAYYTFSRLLVPVDIHLCPWHKGIEHSL